LRSILPPYGGGLGRGFSLPLLLRAGERLLPSLTVEGWGEAFPPPLLGRDGERLF